jgi:hypothetical protein
VLLVVRVVFVSHHPLEVSEARARLEDSEQLFVDNDLLGGVFNSLEGETSINAVVGGGDVVEITLVITRILIQYSGIIFDIFWQALDLQSQKKKKKKSCRHLLATTPSWSNEPP